MLCQESAINYATCRLYEVLSLNPKADVECTDSIQRLCLSGDDKDKGMTTGQTEAKETLSRDHARREAVVAQMLQERSQRQSVSREEIRKMRAEGRY